MERWVSYTGVVRAMGRKGLLVIAQHLIIIQAGRTELVGRFEQGYLLNKLKYLYLETFSSGGQVKKGNPTKKGSPPFNS